MPILTEEDVALLNEPQLAHIAVTAFDGSPHVTAVWIDTDGEHIIFNTAKGRVKYDALVRDPRVGVSIVDRANDFRALWVKGTAELVEDGARAHIDKLSHKYLGKDYPFAKEGEERIIVRITPTAKLGQG
ncbi:PPOX class F420-dependent enzyme [Catellatospora sp. TT07R-123]|uniref:PPOX class F420-dependent oxidoreductase n=1 Tax=Catellatospora sp. TT07R-123 TaxID=2733863 RepID=UPI001B1B9342|nr:PPOX class F420-dependent oxidoreductase [Catellatospora sp. TT07R-123]GHJ45612.1 PPOX class F420-dependent enzyme [Catellatospora sp. TT07R-123]